jgi:hypothetical protein
MRESDHPSSEMNHRESPLHPLDSMEAERREYKVEDRIDDEYEGGATFSEILEGLGGFAEAERLVGTDYARHLQEMAANEHMEVKGETSE